jgi:hypothetical protein
VGQLSRALAPLGIQPTLHEEAIDEATFKAQPSESNRIWINGQSIEALLGARVGASPCCSVCGDSPCRTLELGGSAYESIPASLIVQAGLRAAADLMSVAPSGTACAGCRRRRSAVTAAGPAPSVRTRMDTALHLQIGGAGNLAAYLAAHGCACCRPSSLPAR